MNYIWTLADPKHVARFQKFCGVDLVKPGTCDQQTQTKRRDSEEDQDHDALRNGSFDLDSSSAGQKVTGEQQHTFANGEIGCNGTPGSDLIRRKQNKNGKVKECNNNGSSEPSACNETCNGISSTDNDSRSCNGLLGADEKDTNCSINKNGLINSCNGGGIVDDSKRNAPKYTYTIKYRALLYLARFGAFLGNEECFLTFFPFCVWNLDSLIVRQISLLWGLVMYLGQVTKDYLCWPRPPCPPVARLELHYLQEFSMPSTHAMAGTSIPFYMAYLVVDRYQVPVPVAVALALLWFSTTCFSRLYLGVHSILDLLAGVVYSFVIYVAFIRYIEDYDMYQQTHRFAPVMVLVTALMLCTICYPSKHKITSKGDAVQIVSAVAGFSIGFWLHYQLGYTHEPATLKPYSFVFPTVYTIIASILRFVSGGALLLGYYVVMKKASIRFFSYLYGLDVPDKTNTNVMTGYKFTCYGSMGFIISFLIPLVHVWLGIPRMAFFEEVL